ncbi:uncharacterized protein LOC126905077 [Daktulosphaira vitifoliae]|uniref:uncharacterized protein LOC126905077 n=1 Tax=Daktulosphaira vitifoliae TaxID=58002 RepID=UPI0021AA7D99|nr:uncharacterized protein LOC126905077 [Daktulosphaira vitifoliae]
MLILFMCLCLIPILYSSNMAPINEDDFKEVKVKMFNCLLIAYKKEQQNYRFIPDVIHTILDRFICMIQNDEWDLDKCSVEYFNLMKISDIFKTEKLKKLKAVIKKCLGELYCDLRPSEVEKENENDIKSSNKVVFD